MIYIDPNETATCEIPSKLKSLGLPIEIKSIEPNAPHFDYVIQVGDNMVGVERKEAADYFASKQSGHLDKQLYEYSTNFSLSYLVIIGNPIDVMIEQNLSPKVFVSSLIGSSLKRSPEGQQGQIVTVQLLSDEDFLLFIETLHSKIAIGNFTRLPRFEKATAQNEDIQIANLCTFPNVGPVRAQAILNKYSLEEAYSKLKNNQSLEVKKITPKIEETMKSILRTKGASNDGGL